MCREVRVNATADPAMAVVLFACRSRLHCAACDICLDVANVEQHRAWCPRHRFICPWSTCTQCVPAAELAQHVLAHGVLRLTPTKNVFEIHLILHPSSALVFVADGIVLVLTFESTGFRRLNALTCGYISLRAFYPSPHAPALDARLRQLRVADGEWTEDHRLGHVTPMLATRVTFVKFHKV